MTHMSAIRTQYSHTYSNDGSHCNVVHCLPVITRLYLTDTYPTSAALETNTADHLHMHTGR